MNTLAAGLTEENMRRMLAYWFAVFLGTVPSVVCPSPASAQTSLEKARIAFSIAGTDRQGPTSVMSVSGLDLAIGEEGSTFLFSTLDGKTRGATADETAAAQHPLYWRLAARVVSVELDSVTIELNSARVENHAGMRRTLANARTTITVQQDTHHLLDFVRCPPDSSMANIVIELQAWPRVSDADSLIRLRYDLWLVHQAADGKRTVRKFSLTGKQGRKVTYRFDAVPLPIDAGSEDSPFLLEVDGAVVARAMPDGSVQIALETSRRLVFPTGGGGSSGQKVFTVKLGDNVAVSSIPRPATALVLGGGTWFLSTVQLAYQSVR